MNKNSFFRRLQLPNAVPMLLVILVIVPLAMADDNYSITAKQLAVVKKFEQKRVDAIAQVIDSVIAIYGEERQGGGSGVIIEPSGIGLTNHHVIMGAGTKGWGGLADGQMYRWELIGTDPGGDVAIIQMKGKDSFPFTPLGDSDLVQVGDWSLAMGNPFVLTEDQVPTVTLGIVSGVKRYQPGGAGLNQLVYGNCIQTDSSINPGNSGGPLFNLDGRVIGINGRGSFKERGRVNVGLGYAISANQIKNFIPELLATKLVEHGTLDANFEDRNGKVVCSNLFEDSKLYKTGLRPGDELLEFEGEPISSANQFTNLICTLPEDWPATLLVRDKDGVKQTITTRLYGLPYAKPKRPELPKNEKDQTPKQKEQLKRAQDMIDLLSAPPGTIRDQKVNQKYASQVVRKWVREFESNENSKTNAWKISDIVFENDIRIGSQTTWLAEDGTFKVASNIRDNESTFYFDGSELFDTIDGDKQRLSRVEMKLCPEAVQAIGIAAANKLFDLELLGRIVLDGSDKAQLANAYRLKMIDEDDDLFFMWLSMQNNNGVEDVKLLKAGADLNCEQEFGGIVFRDWVEDTGLRVPQRKEIVKEMAETTRLIFKTESVSRELLVDSLNVDE